jgi:hypothetical protein
MKKIIKGYDGKRHASSSLLASKNKQRGHVLEKEYAKRVSGVVVKGVGKTDVLEKNGENTSCKGAKKHIQLLLQSKDKTIDFYGNSHPISQFVTAGYEVKKFKSENNNNIDVLLFKTCKVTSINLSKWLQQKQNFRKVLSYVFSNDNEINNLVILEDLNSVAYKFKIEKIINLYTDMDFEVYVTKGNKVVVRSIIPNLNNQRKFVIFNMEIRGSKGKIGSINYWIDAQRFYSAIKNNIEYKVIEP